MEYSNSVEKVDDMDGGADDNYDAFCSWIMEPCFPYLRECTAIAREPHLRSFFLSTNPSPETYGLRVFLYAKATRNRRTINPFALMLPSRDLPQYPQSWYPEASAIRIAPTNTGTYDYMSEIPRMASLGDGAINFFKPALDKNQIIREINMHSRLLAAGLKAKIKVANFHKYCDV